MNDRMAVWTNRPEVFDGVDLVFLVDLSDRREMMNVDKDLCETAVTLPEINATDDILSAVVIEIVLSSLGTSLVSCCLVGRLLAFPMRGCVRGKAGVCLTCRKSDEAFWRNVLMLVKDNDQVALLMPDPELSKPYSIGQCGGRCLYPRRKAGWIGAFSR
jgi:hypothetical protein